MRAERLKDVAGAIVAWANGETWVDDVEILLGTPAGYLRQNLERGGITTPNGKRLPEVDPQVATTALLMVVALRSSRR